MQPLNGIIVLDLTRIVSGPFATMLLGDLGAEIIKIEEPATGDESRTYGPPFVNGESAYFLSVNRNKKSCAINLKTQEGIALIKELALKSDVLIENFRPGTLEGWGLDPQQLLELNPRLIVLRISGYGQSGPYRDKPGFGVVAEAMGGLRHLTAEPGRVPVRVGVSIGDTLASLHGVIGILLALQERQSSGKGQIIDVALYEAVFNCMESLLPEYSAFGEVRQAAGSALPGIAPSNAYQCSDGGYVLVAGNGDSIFKRLMKAIGREDLGTDPQLENNDGRVKRVAELDQAIGDWAKTVTTDKALEILDSVSVPVGRIYTVADIANDPHYKARRNIETIQMHDGSKLDVPGVIPKLSRTPGSIKTLAPDIGENTDEILKSIGLNESQVVALKERGIAFTNSKD